jgi:lipopolysaccharide transport system permease protein
MVKQHVSAILEYRDFIFASIRREFEIKYLNSALGALWTIINPLALILIYTLVFSRIMQARLPNIDGTYAYSIYLCTGILLWSLFSEIALKAQTVFLEQANLLKKVNFPRLCLPIVVVGNGLLNFMIIATLFAVFLALVGSLPGVEVLALVPIVALTVWFAVALGIALGILNVFFRDVGHFFSVVLQFWFWLTPIVYPLAILPPVAQELMALNPLAGLIAAAQGVVLREVWPDWSSLAPAAVVAVLMSVLAVRLYLSRGAEMQDEL